MNAAALAPSLDVRGTEWRPIPGHAGYFASDKGRIASVKPWRGSHSPRLLSAHRNRGGYPQVTLFAGRAQLQRVHVLVALTFHGPCPDGQEVRHLDGDRTNNRPANLAYGTRSENNLDAVEHGTHAMASKRQCGNGHAFTDDNTYVLRSRPAARYCKQCQRDRSRAYKARKRAGR